MKSCKVIYKEPIPGGLILSTASYMRFWKKNGR